MERAARCVARFLLRVVHSDAELSVRKVKGLHRRMKAFFRAHAAHSGGGDTPRQSLGSRRHMRLPWSTRTALSALKAHYDSGHQFPHKTGAWREDFNICLSLPRYKTSAIESNDCRPRLNAKKQTRRTSIKSLHTSARACRFAASALKPFRYCWQPSCAAPSAVSLRYHSLRSARRYRF
jgi:hypothetical protein